jgi:hypothetical protein
MKPRLVSWMVQCRRDEEGPTVVDYVLMLALIDHRRLPGSHHHPGGEMSDKPPKRRKEK